MVRGTGTGQAIERLTRQMHNDYPELVASDRVRYAVLACEEGGRWGPVGAGCLRNRQQPRPAQNIASPSAAPALGSDRVHAEMDLMNASLACSAEKPEQVHIKCFRQPGNLGNLIKDVIHREIYIHTYTYIPEKPGNLGNRETWAIGKPGKPGNLKT